MQAIILPRKDEKGKWRSLYFYLCVERFVFLPLTTVDCSCASGLSTNKAACRITTWNTYRLVRDSTYKTNFHSSIFINVKRLRTRRISTSIWYGIIRQETTSSTTIYDQENLFLGSSRTHSRTTKNIDESWGQPVGLCRKEQWPWRHMTERKLNRGLSWIGTS